MTADLRTPPPRAERGPVRATERALAPDLARGAMLVFIALANAAGYFLASTPGVETNPQGFERYFNVFMVEFENASDRDYYVREDPVHRAFGVQVLTGVVEDVMVMDFRRGEP